MRQDPNSQEPARRLGAAFASRWDIALQATVLSRCGLRVQWFVAFDLKVFPCSANAMLEGDSCAFIASKPPTLEAETW